MTCASPWRSIWVTRPESHANSDLMGGSHDREKEKLVARVNRLQGQLESIRSAVEDEKDCAVVLQQIAACRGAINSLLFEIIGEIRFHVLSKNSKVDSREAKAAENLVEILHRYIK